MHVALFGGRFDPIHIGHLRIAEEVLHLRPEIDELWLLPANTHPWKPMGASAVDRLNMVKLTQKGKVKASDIDLKREGDTYTIDTIRFLEETTSNTYIWICGADQIHYFHKWKDYQELNKKITFFIFPRKGYTITKPVSMNATLITEKIFEPIEDSSTEIRNRIKQGKSITGLTPPNVEEYILTHKLYR